MAARTLLECYSPQIGKSLFYLLRIKWQPNVRLVFKTEFSFIVLSHLHAKQSWQHGDKGRYGPPGRGESIWLVLPLYYHYQSQQSHKTRRRSCSPAWFAVPRSGQLVRNGSAQNCLRLLAWYLGGRWGHGRKWNGPTASDGANVDETEGLEWDVTHIARKCPPMKLFLCLQEPN